MCNVNAYSEAIKLFKEKNPPGMANNAGALYDLTRQTITLKYLNNQVEVSFPGGEITAGPLFNLDKNDKVLILQYLTFSCGVQPTNNWLSFIQLPDGPHHHQPFINDAIRPLAEEFGERFDEFREQTVLLGGTETTLGDCGVIIPVFPYLPLAVSLWAGDEEFPANANILFDVTAPLHLSTAALWVLGVEVSCKIRGVSGQQFVRE